MTKNLNFLTRFTRTAIINLRKFILRNLTNRKIIFFFISFAIVMIVFNLIILQSGQIFYNKINVKNYPSFSQFLWCPNEIELKKNFDCRLLFSGHNHSITKAQQWSSPCKYTDEYLMNLTSDCLKLKQNFKFWSESFQIPQETLDYSLAFVIIGARNAEQMIRLLQTIYNKQNLYCVTYDNKTPEEFKQTLHNVDLCYDNIIMPDNFVDIHWAGYSILQTAMFCLKSLIDNNKFQWRYVQILSWNDFPLRTNEEFVTIMKIFNGAQDSLLDLNNMYRSRRYFDIKNSTDNLYDHIDPTKEDQLKNIPPGNLIEYKGSLATTMSREFVKFLFTNPIAKKLYQWLNTSYCAEEIYWSTLMHNLHIDPPGGFPGACFANYWIKVPKIPYLSRYQVWEYENNCGGVLTSHSCVYGVSDLQQLKTRPEFVAHKIYLDFEPATFYCMAELLFNRTFFPNEYPDLIKFYKNWPTVRYQRLKDKEQFNC